MHKMFLGTFIHYHISVIITKFTAVSWLIEQIQIEVSICIFQILQVLCLWPEPFRGLSRQSPWCVASRRKHVDGRVPSAERHVQRALSREVAGEDRPGGRGQGEPLTSSLASSAVTGAPLRVSFQSMANSRMGTLGQRRNLKKRKAPSLPHGAESPPAPLGLSPRQHQV